MVDKIDYTKSRIVMDNLRIHYRKEIKALAEAGGLELLYLQVHSYELNIIETCWAIIKK